MNSNYSIAIVIKMVKELEGNTKTENGQINIGNNHKSIFTIPLSPLKGDVTPFIPKKYKHQHNIFNIEPKTFQENKNKLYMGNNQEKEKKNY